MEVTTPQYTFVSDEPAKAWEGFQQERTHYQDLVGTSRSYLRTAVYSFAVAVPTSTIFSLGVYYHQTNPDGVFTGSVGADLIVGAASFILGMCGINGGVRNLFRARDAEKKLREQEQRMEVSARNLDDLIL